MIINVDRIKKKGLTALLTTVLCLFFTQAKAQRFPFYNLNVENGLVQSQARAMLQDRLGQLWIGTLGGLSRFDGMRFKNYTVQDGMSDNAVYSLAADNAGNIWIGTQKGLSKFNGKTFKHFHPTTRNASSSIVTRIAIDSNNNVWYIAGNKLFTIAHDKIQQVTTPDENALFTALLLEGTDLWTAKLDGTIYHYHQNKWDSVLIQKEAATVLVTHIFRDSRRQLWAATNVGLFILNNGIAKPNGLLQERFENQPILLSITEDKTGSLWIGTNSGVVRLTDSTLNYFNKKNGLSDNSFNNMLTDREGNVWMASDGQGLFRYSGSRFTVVDESSGLPSAQIMSIETDHSGKLFLGTYDAGLYTYENGSVNKLEIPVSSTQGITALRYIDGNLWIGARGTGLLRYNGKYFYSYQGKTLSSNILSLYADPENNLWIGFGTGAMYRRNDSLITVPLNNVAVNDFIRLEKDKMLMATSKGLQLYDGTKITPFITHTVLDSSATQCFALVNNKLWTGTSDHGVIGYDLGTEKAIIINSKTGMQSDFIYNLIADDAGNIWAGTGYGIHRIKLDAEGIPSVLFFGREYGMKGMESNHNAVLKMHDGSIWFGTTNGAIHYKPQSQITFPQPANIVLQSVKLFGENISDSSYYDSTDVWYDVPYNLSLPYKKNNISFSFHAISLANSEQVKYRYRIDGLDAPWSDWSDVNTVTFSALPPGKYQFIIQSKIPGAEKEPTELVYPFEIIAPFHKTDLFKLMILSGCILLGISIQYILGKRKQNRQKLREQLRYEEQNKVRLRTAEDFHDEIGNRLTRINVLTNVLKNKMKDHTPETNRILEKIQENTSQLYSGTRDILWSLKPSNDSLYEILHRIRDFATEIFEDTETEFAFEGTDDRWKKYRMPMDISRNLTMIFKEALNNCLKYSEAKKVKMEVWLRDNNVLQIKMMDYGKGFDMQYLKKGHGIDNMHIRAKRLNGRLYIDSMKERGTIITLTFKLPGNKA